MINRLKTGDLISFKPKSKKWAWNLLRDVSDGQREFNLLLRENREYIFIVLYDHIERYEEIQVFSNCGIYALWIKSHEEIKYVSGASIK